VNQPDLASEHPAVVQFARHVNPAFVKLLGLLGYGRLFVRAKDVWLWDHQGKQYLDFLAGFGAVSLGHNHPRLLERLQRFLSEEALNLCHLSPSPQTGELAAALAARAGESLSVCLFSNSGAEAVDAGLKLARAATGRSPVLYCRRAFHGTNLGVLSVMGDPHLRQPFEPLLPGCQAVGFGDLTALEQALSKGRFGAFLVEPIQGEGGINLPPPGYLAAAQQLCKQHGTLLILDEVQTGLGRTGTWFAHQTEGFVPDVLVLAKALSGGMLPIGVTLTSPALNDQAYGTMSRCELHSSTFGGNAFSCTTGLETLRILEDEGLVANSATRGKQLLEALQKRLQGHPLVREVRGRGLLIGVEFGPTNTGLLNRLCPALVEVITRGLMGQWVALQLLERGVICAMTYHQWNILRLEPPLTIHANEVNRMADVLAEVLEEYRGVMPVLKDSTVRLLQQFLARWKF